MSMPLFLLPPAIASRIQELTERSAAAKKEQADLKAAEKQKEAAHQADKVKEAVQASFQETKPL